MSDTISRAAESGEQESRNRLVEHHLSLVKFLANRFYSWRTVSLDMEDLIQEGYLGLLRAAELYDPEKINPDTGRPYQFSAYASRGIRGMMLRALANKARTIYLPEHIWLDLIHLERVQGDFWLRLQREPSLDELATAMQRTPEQVVRLLEMRMVKSLDAPIPFTYSDESGPTLGDLLEAPDPGQEVEERRAEVTDLLRYLSREERSVIECRYQLGQQAVGGSEDIPLFYAEVARRLQMTRERVQSVEKRALMKMHYWAEHPQWGRSRRVSGE